MPDTRTPDEKLDDLAQMLVDRARARGVEPLCKPPRRRPVDTSRESVTVASGDTADHTRVCADEP